MRDDDDDVIIIGCDDVIVIGLLRDAFAAASELRRRLNTVRNDDAGDDLLAATPLPRRVAFSSRERPSLLSALPITLVPPW